MTHDLRLFYALYSGDRGARIPCSDSLCPRKIKRGEECFHDGVSRKILCGGCGKALRYRRKKAARRGEPIEKVTQ
jgi:hypothetical protein